MVKFFRELDDTLDRLSELLDDEHQCIVEMRYDELLHVVTIKKQVQAMLAGILGRLEKPADLKNSKNTKKLAVLVEHKSRRNERLVRTSLKMVGEVLHLLYSHQPGAGQYDSNGLALAPAGNSTWHDSV